MDVGNCNLVKMVDSDWINEYIENFPGNKFLYRLICILHLKKKMRYIDLYLFTYALYKKSFKKNDTVLKEKILKELAGIYYYNNKKLPYGFNFKQ